MTQIKLILAKTHIRAAEYAQQNEINFWTYLCSEKQLLGKRLKDDDLIVVDFYDLNEQQRYLLELAKARLSR